MIVNMCEGSLLTLSLLQSNLARPPHPPAPTLCPRQRPQRPSLPNDTRLRRSLHNRSSEHRPTRQTLRRIFQRPPSALPRLVRHICGRDNPRATCKLEPA